MASALPLTRPPGWKGLDKEGEEHAHEDLDLSFGNADDMRASDPTPEGDRAGGVMPGRRAPRLCATSTAALSRALQPLAGYTKSTGSRSRAVAAPDHHANVEFYGSSVTSREHDVVDTSSLWDSVDLVRALCFSQPRRFILALEAELVRLLEAPRGAILRLPALSPWYRSLTRSVCARFRVDVKDELAWGKMKVDVTGSKESRLPLPAEAFVAQTWAGRKPNTWRTSLPAASAVKPYLEMVMTAGHDFELYQQVSMDDRVVLISRSGAEASHKQLQNGVWEMPDEWTLRPSSQAKGSTVLTIGLDCRNSGVCIALMSDAGAAAAPLQRLLAGIGRHGTNDISDEEEDPYVIKLEPCTSQQCWIVDLGRASKLTKGLSQGQRIAPWSDSRKSTVWIALMENEDGRLEIAVGSACFPWRRVFKARLSAGYSKFERFGMVRFSHDARVVAGATVESLTIEHGLCPDIATRDHIVSLTWFAARGSRPDGVDGSDVTLWFPRPASNNTCSDDDFEHVLAICPNARAAAELAVLAESSGWETCCMANAPIDSIDSSSAGGDDAAGSPLSASLFVGAVATAASEALRRRAKEVGKLDSDAALDFALCDFVLGAITDDQALGNSSNEQILEDKPFKSLEQLLGTGLRRGPPNSQVMQPQFSEVPRNSETLNPHAKPFEPSRSIQQVVDWDWEEDRDDNNWQTSQEGNLWENYESREDLPKSRRWASSRDTSYVERHDRDKQREPARSKHDTEQWHNDHWREEFHEDHDNDQWQDAAYERGHRHDAAYQYTTSMESRSSRKEMRKTKQAEDYYEEQYDFGEAEDRHDNSATRYVGTIKFYFEWRLFGFIDCDEAVRDFGTDTYLSSHHIDYFKNGDRVSFRVELSKDGRPQARDLQEAEHENQKHKVVDWKGRGWRSKAQETNTRSHWENSEWEHDSKPHDDWKKTDWEGESEQWGRDWRHKRNEGTNESWHEEEYGNKWNAGSKEDMRKNGRQTARRDDHKIRETNETRYGYEEEFGDRWDTGNKENPRKNDRQVAGRGTGAEHWNEKYPDEIVDQQHRGIEAPTASSKRPGIIDKAFFRVAVEGHLRGAKSTGGSRHADQPLEQTCDQVEIEAQKFHIESPESRSEPEQAMPDVCPCGNEFLDDEIFCRKCGVKCEERAMYLEVDLEQEQVLQ